LTFHAVENKSVECMNEGERENESEREIEREIEK
jgi:hypothetical protein